MQLPPLPPAPLILGSLGEYVLPAAGGAALAFGLFLCLGRWAAALGSAAAMIAGFAWANFTFAAPDWEGTSRLIPWKPEPRYAWNYLPRAALTLVGVGLASRWLGLFAGRFLPGRFWYLKNFLVWVPRWIAIVIVTSWVMPIAWDKAFFWLKPALGTVMLLSWIALDGTARGGSGWQAALSLFAMFLAAGTVAIYAHSSLFMTIAVVFGFAMLGVAAIACAAKADTSGAIPAGVAVLPALLLNARYQGESLVPMASFWLVAVAPLILLPFLIPRIARQNRWLLLTGRTVLVLAPLAIGVALALANEQLPPQEEWG
jgi:hypothetical protein